MTASARASLRLRDRGSMRFFSTALEHRFAAPAIALAQFAWLWWAYARGWFFQADLSNMSESVGRRLDWGYLTRNLGGHFAPVDRLVYWVQYELAPLDYGPAIAIRLVCQFAATLLLHRLLCRLTDERAVVTVIVALYAFNPMLLAGTTMFTPGIGITMGQLAVVLALLAHVNYDRTRRLRHEIGAGLLLAFAMLCSEQWAIATLILPLLSLLRTYENGLRDRLRELVRRWRGWLLAALPPIAAGAAAAYYVVPIGAQPTGIGAVYKLLRDSWLDSLAPTLVGGPFQWYAGSHDYFGFAAPSDTVIVLGQLAFAALVVLGLRRRGPASLLGWLIPLLCWVASMALIGYRGYAQYGLLIAVTPRYMSALIMIFAVGATVALTRPVSQPPPDVPDRDETPASASSTDTPGQLPAVGFACLALLLAANLASGLRFATVLGRQQAETWVMNLRSSAQLAGAGVNVYDTPLPFWLIDGVEPHHRVSDLLRLAGIDARLESPASTPLVASSDGHLVPSVFVPAGSVTPVGSNCGSAVRGRGTFTFPLDRAVPDAEWWLRLTLFEQTPSTVRIHLVDATGAVVAPVSGAQVRLSRLESLSLRLPRFGAVAVRITSTSRDTALCLTSIQVGAPFPARP